MTTAALVGALLSTLTLFTSIVLFLLKRLDAAQERRTEMLRELFEARLRTLTTMFEERDRDWRTFEREVLKWRVEMPVEYVRREDQMRMETLLNAKMDALYQRLETLLSADRREAHR